MTRRYLLIFFSSFLPPFAAILDPQAREFQTYEYARKMQRTPWSDVSNFNNDSEDDSSDDEEVKKTN